MSKRRHSHSRRHTHRKHTSRYKKTHNLAGKLLVLIELLMTIIFIAAVWTSGMIPGSYIAVLSVTLLVLFGVLFGLQFLKNKVYIVGIVFSILISIALGFGSYYMFSASRMLEQVGGASYKTDNMIVVVRADDSAEISRISRTIHSACRPPSIRKITRRCWRISKAPSDASRM